MPELGLSVSIVSHGHGATVIVLLEQIAALMRRGGVGPSRLFLTVNWPEPELVSYVRDKYWPFVLIVLENQLPAGFGANHNRAFEKDQALGVNTVFGVVNPDVRLLGGQPFSDMLDMFVAAPWVGCVYPRQVDANGVAQDHERLLPTPMGLVRRYLLRQRWELMERGQLGPDWVNAAFVLLRSEAFAQIGGFDERYHMYGEDVDLSLRLRLSGWTLMRAESVLVEHAAQRASHRDLRHFVWHILSLLRLWRSPAYRDFKRSRVMR